MLPCYRSSRSVEYHNDVRYTMTIAIHILEDADDFEPLDAQEPVAVARVVNDKWDGEDEDDEIKVS